MERPEPYAEINLMDYLSVLWKRKWLIIIPTAFLALAAGIISFRMTPVWEVDSIIQPSKFLVQTQQGQFDEVLVADPKQIAGQINQASYNGLIAAELNMNLQEFPQLKADPLRDTKLVKISLRDPDVNKGMSILNSLFNHLKADFDKKIDVEIKDVDTQIAAKESEIEQKELTIKDNLIEIKLLNIQKEKTRQEILSQENMFKISEERYCNISEEMKSVKLRIDGLENELKKSLEEKKQSGDAVAFLLYSNEVQNNLHYYDTLNEKLSLEKISQENIQLSKKGKTEELKETDTNIEKLRNDSEKIKSEIKNLERLIELLKEKKMRIDYTKLIKEPTPSLKPVYPKKLQNIAVAGFLGFLFSAVLAFFLEYIKKQKEIPSPKS